MKFPPKPKTPVFAQTPIPTLSSQNPPLPPLPKEPETRLVKECDYRPTKTIEVPKDKKEEPQKIEKTNIDEKEYLKVGKKYISKKIFAYTLFGTHVGTYGSKKDVATLHLSGTGKEFGTIEIWDIDEIKALKGYLERNSETIC